MSKVVVSFSGGMDSATVLAEAEDAGHEVFPVSFKYPSKHNKHEYDVGYEFLCERGYWPTKDKPDAKPWRHTFDLTSVFDWFSSDLLQSGREVPEGHYEAENMRLTVVPGRNIIFASVLAGYAWSIGASEVWLGIHAGDHFIYPDCRPEFYKAMKEAIKVGTDNKVHLRAPFLYGTKRDIILRGNTIGVNYALTRTCYKDQPMACGKCGSCQERLQAFADLGLRDPLQYETRELISKHS